jgi:hypothetical protein
VLFDADDAYASLEADGRLRVRRGGSAGTTVCNVTAARIVSADVREDWLALRGAVDRVDFARREPGVGMVGPFDANVATALARAIADGLGLPRSPERVANDALRADPERFHERFIEAEGEWSVARDASNFANAWLYAPDGVSFSDGTRRVRGVGLFRCTGSRDFDGRRDGHGRFGTSPAEIDAFEIHELA